jgi:hypothetical protein
VAVALTLTGCGIAPIDPLNPGARQWIIPVDNRSNLPVVVAVAKDVAPMGNLMGTAVPNPVPPLAKVDVVFTVPPAGQDWAIFVNPGPNRGALITARDVPPGRAGRLPISIGVDAKGEPFVSVPNEPGWFGQ